MDNNFYSDNAVRSYGIAVGITASMQPMSFAARKYAYMIPLAAIYFFAVFTTGIIQFTQCDEQILLAAI